MRRRPLSSFHRPRLRALAVVHGSPPLPVVRPRLIPFGIFAAIGGLPVGGRRWAWFLPCGFGPLRPFLGSAPPRPHWGWVWYSRRGVLGGRGSPAPWRGSGRRLAIGGGWGGSVGLRRRLVLRIRGSSDGFSSPLSLGCAFLIWLRAPVVGWAGFLSAARSGAAAPPAAVGGKVWSASLVTRAWLKARVIGGPGIAVRATAGRTQSRSWTGSCLSGGTPHARPRPCNF